MSASLLVKSAILVALGVALAVFWGRLDVDKLHALAREQSAVAVIAAVAITPLVGFPISLLHLIAGVRFDLVGGLAVVLFTGLIHHALGWFLVRVLPRRTFKSLTPWRAKLAGAGHRDASLLCCLLPGMPYSVQLYLLPVMGVPLKLLLGLCVPLHTARAVVTILLGDSLSGLTTGRAVSLAVYYVVLFGVSTWALLHLRRTLSEKNKDLVPIDPERIATRAEEFWQQAGRPGGRDVHFWLEAEKALRQETPATEGQNSA
ncbi:MAG: DUF2934 domain-containing protein [Opitutaceae bacterium]|nr:DUF2934 domain-containing protein [Opitutaceae bacterium]